MDIQQVVLQQSVELFMEEAGDNLVGVYLHGSMAMGCFNPKKSDLDLLVVLRHPESADCYRRITKRLIEIESILPKGAGGIELSVLLEDYLSNITYPTPFELHYSAFHREKYRADDQYLCGGFEDPDLPAHIMISYYRGITLYGQPIKKVFEPVDNIYYVQSILRDVKDATENIIQNPVYYTLNLCRVLLFLKEEQISSKQEGGEWGIQALPVKYNNLIHNCLVDYADSDNVKFKPDPELMLDFAEYMKKEIINSAARYNL